MVFTRKQKKTSTHTQNNLKCMEKPACKHTYMYTHTHKAWQPQHRSTIKRHCCKLKGKGSTQF